MFRFFPKRCGWAVIWLLVASWAGAQETAREWLDAAILTYRQEKEWSGYVAVQRVMMAQNRYSSNPARPRGATESVLVQQAYLGVCDLRVNAAGGWVAYCHQGMFWGGSPMMESEMGGRPPEFRSSGRFARMPGGELEWTSGDKKTTPSPGSADANLSMYMRGNSDVPLLADVLTGDGLGRVRLTFPEYVLVGRETIDAVAHVVVDGRGDEQTVRFWIAEQSKLITRMVSRAARSREMREVVVTLEPYAEGSARGFAAAPVAMRSRSASSLGLSAPSGVWRLARALPRPLADSGADLLADPRPPEETEQARPGAPSSPATPAAPATPVAPVVAAPSESQTLTPEQMSGVVLIEGDGGAGTGFVAMMKGVPFVITNLHVAGGNQNMKIETVGGEKVKTGQMFGAVGRDLALLRIEGEWKGPMLTLCEDPLKSAKLGDKVVVVGNRRGGGVATQVSGVVQGIGPDKIEVNAPFQPGNSGSPVIQVSSGEVLGLASYSLTRKLDMLDAPSSGAQSGKDAGGTEQRWFGYRTDGAMKWEAIDQAKWRTQEKRLADFLADSEAIYYAMQARFTEASGNAKVRVVVDRFQERVSRAGNSRAPVLQAVNEYFRSLRALTDDGVKELKTGEFYDFFRSSGYWESSIPEQLAAREDLARRIEAATENVESFLAKARR